jgi:hypothetical protein
VGGRVDVWVWVWVRVRVRVWEGYPFMCTYRSTALSSADDDTVLSPKSIITRVNSEGLR